MTMKTKNAFKNEKNIDLLISKISHEEILGINSMMSVRGGDHDNTLPPPPPPKP